MRTAIAPADFQAMLHGRSSLPRAECIPQWPVTFATFHNQWMPALIVIAAVLFNAVLAILNGHFVRVNQYFVVGTELLLVVTAHAIALSNFRPQMLRWYILIGALFAIAILRGLVLQDFDAKLFRDVLLIPTFILLGITFKPRGLPTLIVLLVGIYAVFMVLEAVNTPAYASLFKIQDFYIDTRGFTEANFWNKDSPLFASAIRPDGRFLDIVELHRLSSVFLEPVGSETFCIIVWTFICTCYNRLSRGVLVGLFITTLAMIVGTDGRLALVMSGIILVLCLIAPRLPRALSFFYLPSIAASVALLVYLAALRYDIDDFGGRLAFSMHLLGQFDVAELLGVSNTLLRPAADAGLAYLILSQSLFGALLLWSFISLGSRQDTLPQIRYIHSTCLWLSLFMMVGAAFLTIKTAALLWFIYGSLQRDETPEAAAALAKGRRDKDDASN